MGYAAPPPTPQQRAAALDGSRERDAMVGNVLGAVGMPDFVVVFGGCDEACLRTGPDAESVNEPDDLGCEATEVIPAEQVEIADDVWEKNGVLRVKVLRRIPDEEWRAMVSEAQKAFVHYDSTDDY